VSTYEDFKKYFAPFSYEAKQTMEEHMSEEKETTGVIDKVAVSETEKYTKYSFKLDDGEWYSQFKNNIPDDALDVVTSLKEGDTVFLKWEPSKCGRYRNFIYAEHIIQQESPPDAKPPPTSTAYTNRDRIELLRIAANNATALTKTDGEEADPKQWAVMFSTILQTLKTEFPEI